MIDNKKDNNNKENTKNNIAGREQCGSREFLQLNSASVESRDCAQNHCRGDYSSS